MSVVASSESGAQNWDYLLGVLTLYTPLTPLHGPDQKRAPSTNNNNYEIWCDKFVQLILRALAQYDSSSEIQNLCLYQFYTSYTSSYTQLYQMLKLFFN